MPHAFVSYVQEDWNKVEQLAAALKARGIDVWLDREQLSPGDRWQDAIRQAIREGHFFLACFSAGYAARDSTYMNEELVIAIGELRKMPTERTWFIPVLLDPGTVPDRAIGGGETLRDIQYVDLHSGWSEGVRRLAFVMNPPSTRAARIARSATMLRARPQQEIANWVMWAWDDGSIEDQEVASSLGYGEIDPEIQERERSREAQNAQWLRETLETLDRGEPSRETWLSLLIRAEAHEEVDRQTALDIEPQALQLSRRGAVVGVATGSSGAIYTLTQRGLLLLDWLRSDA
jgi:hypothetical protein